MAHSDRRELIIDPGPAFGGGDHPTTLMALELTETAVEKAKKDCDAPAMLDVGTGTGVLAIAGKGLGTGLTLGLDTDAAAVFTARRNLALNSLNAQLDRRDSVVLMIGTLDTVRSAFPIVAANLAAPTLLRLSRQFHDRAERLLILSGMAEEMVNDVVGAYQAMAMRVNSRRERDGWHAALLTKG